MLRGATGLSRPLRGKGTAPSGWVVAFLVVALPVMEWGGGFLVRNIATEVTTELLWASTIAANVVFLMLLLLLARQGIHRAFSLPRCRDWAWIAGALVAGWVAIPIVQALVAPLAISQGTPASGPGLSPSTNAQVMLVAVAAVVTSLAQEALYRGLLWELVVKVLPNDWIAVGVTSLAFGSIYLSNGAVTFLSAGVAWGAIAGLLYMRTRSLSAVVIMNALNLFLTYCVLFRYFI